MGYQLILDTSFNQLVVGIADDYEIIYKVQYQAHQKQSELTVFEIDKAFKAIDIDASDLSRIIVTRGPGSYTGVRIAMTIAKVMSYVHKIPVCAVSTLQALTGLAPKSIAILDARSDKVYVGVYTFGKAKTEEQIILVKDLEKFISKYKEYEIFGDRHLVNHPPLPIDIAQNMYLASKEIKDVKFVDTLVPVYLKD
jgi:tRNA threonylcarbamoyladenosine biosynthesis protein TsaB